MWCKTRHCITSNYHTTMAIFLTVYLQHNTSLQGMCVVHLCVRLTYLVPSSNKNWRKFWHGCYFILCRNTTLPEFAYSYDLFEDPNMCVISVYSTPHFNHISIPDGRRLQGKALHASKFHQIQGSCNSNSKSNWGNQRQLGIKTVLVMSEKQWS